MEAKFDQTFKTGDIVTEFPKASQIFKKYRIDFCCGGDRLIGDVLDKKGLDEEKVLNELNSLYEETKMLNETHKDWQTIPYAEFIDYVVNKHHAYLYNVLPELDMFSTKIYRVHGAHHPELDDVHQLVAKLKAELEHHLIQEEEAVFPKIKDFEQQPTEEKLNALLKVISILEAEHDQAGNIIKQLRDITSDFTTPADGCNTYRLTYMKLEELENDLFEHIHLENNIMFKRLEQEKIA